MITTREELCDAVNGFGVLPFFRSVVRGLSLEELADKSIWFPPDGMGAWEWKEDIIKMTGGAYGSFFCSCPGFVSKEMLFPLLAYRRNGYDFEGFSNDGHARSNERKVYQILEETGEENSTFLKAKCKLSDSSFGEAMKGLQMNGFVIVSGFDYRLTKDGRKYGWGITRYALPEAVFGDDTESMIDSYTPESAFDIMKKHLMAYFPDDEHHIEILLGGRRT